MSHALASLTSYGSFLKGPPRAAHNNAFAQEDPKVTFENS